MSITIFKKIFKKLKKIEKKKLNNHYIANT